MNETKKTITLQEQAEQVLRNAEERGVESSLLFKTTFKRYQVQLNILTKLEKAIAEEGTLVEKEYVKGRKNLYASPAVTEYNKTATAANNTVVTLINIVKNLGDSNSASSSLEEVMKNLMKDD